MTASHGHASGKNGASFHADVLLSWRTHFKLPSVLLTHSFPACDGSFPSTALSNHTGARKMDSAQLYLPTVPQKIDQKGRGLHSFWRGKNIFWPHFPNHTSIGWLHAGSDKYWASLRLMYTPKRLDHKREKLRQEGANAACCQDGALLHHTDLSSSGTKAGTEVGIWLKADEAPPSATGTHIAAIKQISPEFCEDTKTNYHGSHHF